jgi:hypothetical protein
MHHPHYHPTELSQRWNIHSFSYDSKIELTVPLISKAHKSYTYLEPVSPFRLHGDFRLSAPAASPLPHHARVHATVACSHGVGARKSLPSLPVLPVCHNLDRSKIVYLKGGSSRHKIFMPHYQSSDYTVLSYQRRLLSNDRDRFPALSASFGIYGILVVMGEHTGTLELGGSHST